MLLNTYNGILSIERNGQKVLFDPDSLAVFAPSSKESIQSSIDAFLKYKAGASKAQQFGQNKKFNSQKTFVTFLLISNTCNLRCKYCFAGGGNYGQTPGFMSKETVKQAIDFVTKTFSDFDEFRFVFFGGEPLLDANLLEYAVSTAKKAVGQKKVSFNLTTNGTVFNDALFSIMSENNVSFSISVDGDIDAHDSLRKTVDGKGSFCLIKKNLERFRLVNRNLTFRTSVTPLNMDLKKTYERFKDLGANQVNFVPVTVDKRSPLSFTENDLGRLQDEFSGLADIFLEDLLKNENSLEVLNFSRFIRSIFLSKKRYTYCDIGHKMIAVNYLGNLYPCHRFVGDQQHCLGSIFLPLDSLAFEAYTLANQSTNFEQCNDCPARLLCGGPCYHNHTCKEKLSSITCSILRHNALLSVWLYFQLALKKPSVFEKIEQLEKGFNI